MRLFIAFLTISIITIAVMCSTWNTNAAQEDFVQSTPLPLNAALTQDEIKNPPSEIATLVNAKDKPESTTKTDSDTPLTTEIELTRMELYEYWSDIFKEW